VLVRYLFREGVLTKDLSVDRGINAEASGGLPGEHVFDDVTVEQAVAVEVTEHAVAHGVLELVPVGGLEMGGLVELGRAQHP